MLTRFLAKGTLFLAAPLLLVEIGVRLLAGGPLAGTDRLVDFYQPVAAHVDTASVDALFLGNSRVAAAVVPGAFADAAFDHTGVRIHALNAGQGYATPAVHYYGLTRLLKQHPERFAGATIFVETRDGLPDESTWSDAWAHPEWPTLLSPVLPAADVPAFVWKSDNDGATKTLVTASSPLVSVRLWKFLRAKVQSAPSAVVNRLSAALAPSPPPSPPPAAADSDLTDAGGIRTDSAGVALARERALAAAESTDGHAPLTDWSVSVWADLHREVHAAGGRLVFFDVPMSTVDRAAFDGPTYAISRAAFSDWTRRHDIPVLTPDATFDDADFPDFYHLAHSQAERYTRALATASFHLD